MALTFHPRTWRSNLEYTNQELVMPLGEGNFLITQRKLIEEIKNFIRVIFNYDQIEIKHTETDFNKKQAPPHYISSELKANDGHSRYTFGVKLFDETIHEFEINNIPALEENKHIEVFFDMIKQYMRLFYQVIDSQLSKDRSGNYRASQDIMLISDSLLYNLPKTIILEYLYTLFNDYDANYELHGGLVPQDLRYNVDLLNDIYNFSVELSNRKIENKEIFCGFVFHDNVEQIENNAVKVIKLANPIRFGNFEALKHLLMASNGQNVFFNVTDSHITHIIVTRSKVREISFIQEPGRKTFSDRPLIVSIQGEGKIYFIEGRESKNKILLQIINSKPLIRDRDFIRIKLFDHIRRDADVSDEKIHLFIEWILSLSLQKNGTTIILGNFGPDLADELVKSTLIDYQTQAYLEGDFLTYDIDLLTHLTRPDGGLIFNKHLTPVLISAILPFTKSSDDWTTGGARHQSTMHFTNKHLCLGIVVSDDGPITIFRNGQKLAKF